MWKHIGKNPEYVMVGDSEENRRGKQVREPLVTVPGSTSGFDKIGSPNEQLSPMDQCNSQPIDGAT